MRGRSERRTWEHDPAVHAPPRYRKACHYDGFVPDGLAGFESAWSTAVSAVVSEAELAVRSLNEPAHFGDADPGLALAPLARLLLRTESIASSKVEGIQLDARSLAQAEARLKSAGRASPRATEIIANIDAMELAIHEAVTEPELTRETIVSIHRSLLAPTPDSRIAGVVRAEQNWIGGNDHNPCGAAYVPPPPEYLDDGLDDLCRFAGEDMLSPLAHAAIVHAQFELLHPFMAGNGRTGRALIHVILRRRGLVTRYVPPVSVVLAREKDRYIAGLERFRNGDIAGWVESFAAWTTRAARLAADHLAAVTQLQERWRARVRESGPVRADSAVWALIDALPAHPVINLQVATAATGLTKATVNLALKRLAESGVLEPLTQGRRNRLWEATGLLDVLVALEAGEPVRPVS